MKFEIPMHFSWKDALILGLYLLDRCDKNTEEWIKQLPEYKSKCKEAFQKMHLDFFIEITRK